MTGLKGVGGVKHKDVVGNVLANHSQIEENPAKIQRRQLRQRRREKRLTDLLQQDDEEATNLENAAIMRSKVVGSAVLGKYSIWRREFESDSSDSSIKLIRDQLIMGRVYASIARSRNQLDIYNDLMLHMKESQ